MRLSQTELASRLGLSTSAVAMYESGAREPRIDTLEAYADIFNVSVDTLMGREEEHTPLHLLPKKVLKLCDTVIQLSDKDLETVIAFASFLSSRCEKA
ncbi:MAG: helix-turn-helix domain-containing protein [Bacteroidaceae bacterium]|nr:helix-turn-helix domain-containing protein [Bacteroidaceae bacterium]